MQDVVHPSNTGITVLLEKYLEQIENKKVLSSAQPELKNTIRYYKSGTLTGTWTKTRYTSLDNRLLGGQTFALISDTTNDTIAWTGIVAEQLHILYKIDATYGTFDIIIDEGTTAEKTISFNCAVANTTAWNHGHFVCDFLESGTHTVKLKITSTAKTVAFQGLIAI